jgi:hypothetical protein
MNVIDALSNSIQKFSITHDENRLDQDLDDIMSKINKVELCDPEENWVVLQTNYSKLKYLFECITYANVKSNKKFLDSLSKFMESIDETTQIYLDKIAWREENENNQKILCTTQNLFFDSLNKNDPIEKLNKLIQAYNIFVPIVEQIVGQECKEDLDPSFLSAFEPHAKRQRK